MAEARRIVRQQFGRDHHPVCRVLAKVFTAIAWPPAVLIHIWKIRRDRGSEEVQLTRMPAAFWTALRHNVLPGEYYAYALWLPERKKNIDKYLYSNECPRLFKALNESMEPDPVSDKLAFYNLCKAYKIPSPTVFRVFIPGYKTTSGSRLLPKQDLFVKPGSSLAGEGTERFRWNEEGYTNCCGSTMSPKELHDYLSQRAVSERRNLLVQPLLTNHPKLGQLGPLATVRLVTGLSTRGQVTAIFGFLSLGKLGNITSQHGEIVLIDVTNGKLLAESVQVALDTLPDWGSALRYAQIAHRLCRHCAFVGWDVALTKSGPMLLEGNKNWSADEYQNISGKPLGQLSFASILEDRLKR